MRRRYKIYASIATVLITVYCVVPVLRYDRLQRGNFHPIGYESSKEVDPVRFRDVIHGGSESIKYNKTAGIDNQPIISGEITENQEEPIIFEGKNEGEPITTDEIAERESHRMLVNSQEEEDDKEEEEGMQTETKEEDEKEVEEGMETETKEEDEKEVEEGMQTETKEEGEKEVEEGMQTETKEEEEEEEQEEDKKEEEEGMQTETKEEEEEMQIKAQPITSQDTTSVISIHAEFTAVPAKLETATTIIIHNQSIGIAEEESDEEFMERMKLRMEARRNHIKKVCKEQGYHDSISRLRPDTLYFERFKTYFCHVPKTGSKNWSTLFLKLYSYAWNGKVDEAIDKTDFDFEPFLRKYRRKDTLTCLERNDTLKIFVVREPMERLISAFRDRLDVEPKDYLKPLSRKMHQVIAHDMNSASYATFNEFVSYVMRYNKFVRGDIHWRLYHHLCQPCVIDYDIIGHKETMEEDARYFLMLLEAPPDIRLKGGGGATTKLEVMREYFDQVKPMVNVHKIHSLLRDDYLLFNYSSPEILNYYAVEPTT